MLDLDRTKNLPSALQDRLLVMETPDEIDVDLVWDAFIVFAEGFFDIDIVDDDVLSWGEVDPAQFDDALNSQLNDTSLEPVLRAIRTVGRIAIVAPEGCLNEQGWADVKNALKSSQDIPGHSSSKVGWRIVIDPAFSMTAKANPGEPVSRSASRTSATIIKSSATEKIPTTVQPVNRRGPVPASPEQEAFLRMRVDQQNGQHPTIAMEPVFLDAPDADALSATFEALQERHEILHTKFMKFNELHYIVLDDNRPVPLRRQRVLRPTLSIARLAEQKTAELSKSLGKSGDNWQAALFQTRARSVLVCVFSKTIADQLTVDLFRSEVVAFYEAFKAGEDPEATFPVPSVQYTDFAALPRETAPQANWWDSMLPVDLNAQPKIDLPVLAPARRWKQSLPSALVGRLAAAALERGTSPESIILSAFLQSLQKLEDEFVPWLIVPLQDLRPPEAAGMLGQFTQLCPVWVGQLKEPIHPAELDQRLDEIRRHGALSFDQLSLALPDRVPDRIAYFFEYSQIKSIQCDIDLCQDINLSVQNDGDNLIANWAVRLDHPLCKQQRRVTGVFRSYLNNLSAV